MKKLAVLITHPIQYYVPVFQLLAKQCILKVFYSWGEAGSKAKYEPDFKKVISWDLPLLEGYDFQFLPNHAENPGSHHFGGIKNKDLISNIISFSPHAILIYGWSYQSHLSALRYFKGKIPVWFRGDSTLIDHQSRLKTIARDLFLKWVYNYIDLGFYVGSANKAYFEKFGLNEQQLIFAPHAIDNDRFSEDRNEEVNLLRKSFGIKDDETLILFAGKFERKKNPELLLQAFLDLNLQHTHLLFVGNGDLEESLKLKAKKIFRRAQDDTYEKVHFMGFQNQSYMPVIYQACDLLVLPSKSETWGLSVNEAMAAGKAILVSDKVGCATDLIDPEKNGDIFQSANHSDFISKLSALAGNKIQLKQMGLQSKLKIKDWNFEQQINQIIRELHAI